MPFVPAVRDYIELINNLYHATSTDPNIVILIKNTVIYLFETLRYLIFYLLTFQWFRDLSYLPIINPQISLSLIKEKIFLHDPFIPVFTHFFTFLETPALSNNTFLIGFSNSFFTCLPISCSSLICFYRLMINGIPAALFSFLGNILGQFFFLICVLFGLRSFIVPWFSLEPLNYVIGLCIVLSIVAESIEKRSWTPIEFSEKNKLFPMLLTHFLLIWTEEPSIYKHIGNLTLSSDSTILETLTSNGDINFFINHSFYLFGFLAGSFLFSILFSIGILKIRSFSSNLFHIRYSLWLTQFHRISMLFITALALSSMPYYGFDYILTKHFGFISYDTALEKTIFHVPSFGRSLLETNEYTDGGLYEKQLGSLVDLPSFDKSSYLLARPSLHLDDPEFAIDCFEDLNYQGEYAWLSRHARNKKQLDKTFKTPLEKLIEIENARLEDHSFIDNADIPPEKRFSPFSFQKQKRKSKSKTFRTNPLLRKKFGSKKRQKTDFEIWRLLSPFSLQNNWFFKPEEVKKNRSKTTIEALGSDFHIDEVDFKVSDFFYKMADTSFFPTPSIITEDYEVYENLVVREELKNVFYTNPLYRFLLEKDVDAFLSRQPKDHFLSVFEEKQLSRNRSVLNNYYNTLRSYKLVEMWRDIEHCGAFSYANQIYHQQFKGTFYLLRRLFSITVNPLEPENEIAQNKDHGNSRILKLDQPLYKTSIGNSSYLFDLKNHKKDESKVKEDNQSQFHDKNLQNEKNSSQVKTLPNLLMHEEVQKKGATLKTQESDSDTNQPQEVETNFATQESGSDTNQPQEVETNFATQESDSDTNQPQEVETNFATQESGSDTNQKISDREQKINTIVEGTGLRGFATNESENVFSYPNTAFDLRLKSEVSENENRFSSKQKHLIESTNPAPFYVGWDENSRKMVITNRLLFSFDQNPITTLDQDLLTPTITLPENKLINNNLRDSSRFTTWAIPKSMVKPMAKEKGFKSFLPDRSYKVLFDFLETTDMGTRFDVDLYDAMEGDIPNLDKAKGFTKEIPSNIPDEPNFYHKRRILSPDRGGFIWPGSKSSQRNIIESLKALKDTF